MNRSNVIVYSLYFLWHLVNRIFHQPLPLCLPSFGMEMNGDEIIVFSSIGHLLVEKRMVPQ
jgi:hypothetical protein